jgi:hypothetical protein
VILRFDRSNAKNLLRASASLRESFYGSSLFSVGKREDRGKIWNSDATDAKQRPSKPTQEVTARQTNQTDEKVFNSEQSIKDAK